jgi:hypothetical protein
MPTRIDFIAARIYHKFMVHSQQLNHLHLIIFIGLVHSEVIVIDSDSVVLIILATQITCAHQSIPHHSKSRNLSNHPAYLQVQQIEHN